MSRSTSRTGRVRRRCTRRTSCREIDLDAAPPPRVSKQLLTELGPEGFARWLRESKCRRRHRHHVPRRASVAAGHPGAHHRPADGRALHRADDAAAVVDRVLGRRDLRCGASVLEGRSVGAAGRAARGGAQHLPADAAARAATPSATRRTRRRSPTAFVDEATATGIDIYRIFDALNNVDSMRPAIDAVRETGTAIAEVAMSYTGDLSDPEREPLHAGLLPEAGRADRRRRRARAGDQGHGRAAAPAGRDAVGQRAAQSGSTCRCTCTPTTPPAVSWPPIWRRGRPAPTPSTVPSAPLAGTTSQPALSLDRGRRGAHRVRHRAVAVGGVRSGAVLGGAAKGVRALRIRASRRRRDGCITTRSPAASCRTCVSRPSRWGWGTGSRRSRTNYAARRPDAGPAGEGDAVVEGGRRPRAGPGRRGRQRRRIRRRPRDDSTFPIR